MALQRQAAVGGTVALVTHGLVIRALLASQVSLGASMGLPEHIGNTSLSIVDVRAPHQVTLLNCTRHLDDDGVRDDAHALSGG